MKKIIFILFFAMAGIFVLPLQSEACDMGHSDSHAACCQAEVVKQQTSSTSPSSCTEKPVKDQEGTHNDCGQGCNSSACGCPTVNVVVGFVLNDQCNNAVYYLEKNRTRLINSDISSGFSSIWQPPKIG